MSSSKQKDGLEALKKIQIKLQVNHLQILKESQNIVPQRTKNEKLTIVEPKTNRDIVKVISSSPNRKENANTPIQSGDSNTASTPDMENPEKSDVPNSLEKSDDPNSLEKSDDQNPLENLLCGICSNEYGDEKVPKMLQCGHTHCEQCIAIEDKSSCSFLDCCLKYSVLPNFTNKCILKMAKQNQIKVSKSCQNLSKLNELKKIISYKTKILIQEKDIKIKILYSNLELIEKLLEEPQTVNEDSSSNLIEQIEKEVSSVIEDIKFISKIFAEPSDNSETFLLKFGDLKTAVASVKFRIFMMICPNGDVNRIIMIKTLNSVLVPQFIRLCTGESNESYIGKIYGDDYKYSNIDYFYVTNKKNSSVPENKKKSSVVTECFVLGNSSGDFWFSSSEIESKLIGVVETPSNLLEIIKDENKILDCGIAFYL